MVVTDPFLLSRLPKIGRNTLSREPLPCPEAGCKGRRLGRQKRCGHCNVKLIRKRVRAQVARLRARQRAAAGLAEPSIERARKRLEALFGPAAPDE